MARTEVQSDLTHADPQSLDAQARAQIAHWIKSTGTSQAALSLKIGRSQVWVSRYLRGEFNADLTTLAAIAHEFGHTLSALLSLPSDPTEAAILKMFRACRPQSRRAAVHILTELSRER